MLDEAVGDIARESRAAAERLLIQALDAASSLDIFGERGRIVSRIRSAESARAPRSAIPPALRGDAFRNSHLGVHPRSARPDAPAAGTLTADLYGMSGARVGRVVGWLLPLILFGSAQAQETSMVPVTIDGQTVRLEMRVYKPGGSGPAPTLVFNHGSTGSGTEASRFTWPLDYPALARLFVERGWAVVIPARRGRGGSEGVYDEGFSENRVLGYSCEPALSIPGADRALGDVEAAMAAILAMPFVDRTRVAIGGQSRGGILCVYAGRHPEQVKGVVVVRRVGPVLPFGAQPRQFRGLPGGGRQGPLPRVSSRGRWAPDRGQP
jgi:hypothetical protein